MPGCNAKPWTAHPVTSLDCCSDDSVTGLLGIPLPPLICLAAVELMHPGSQQHLHTPAGLLQATRQNLKVRCEAEDPFGVLTEFHKVVTCETGASCLLKLMVEKAEYEMVRVDGKGRGASGPALHKTQLLQHAGRCWRMVAERRQAPAHRYMSSAQHLALRALGSQQAAWHMPPCFTAALVRRAGPFLRPGAGHHAGRRAGELDNQAVLVHVEGFLGGLSSTRFASLTHRGWRTCTRLIAGQCAACLRCTCLQCTLPCPKFADA